MITEAEYQRMVRIALAEKAAAIADAERKFRDRLESLRQVRELMDATEKPSNRGALSAPLKRGDVTGRVHMALAKMPDVFSLRDLREHIRQIDPTGEALAAKAISIAIKRMAGREVEIIEVGKGKRGNRYRKIKNLK